MERKIRLEEWNENRMIWDLEMRGIEPHVQIATL
jgi:hypothetical protein